MLRRLKIRLTNWEYWPQWLVYLPLGIYYIYLSARARSFFFFSAANPGIETGGMFFESKWDVFQLLPKHIFPATVLIKGGDSIEEAMKKLDAASLSFPLIAKPDRGERGWNVQKIHSVAELAEYRQRVRVDFLLQDYVDYPVELSVFYIRHPKMPRGQISSVTYKKLLSVTGDGKTNLEKLITDKDRAFLQKDVLFRELQAELSRIPVAGEEILLVPYGNHVRGAEFRDYGAIVDAELAGTFDHICKQVPGFFYGRFDIRAKSVDALKQGKDFAILELNGSGAEPAHIYDPSYKFINAQKDLFWHYRQMYDIAIYNKRNGEDFMTYIQYRQMKRKEKVYKQMAA